MYYCEDCEEFFSEAKTVEEHHPYGMTYATEYWAVCPHCGSTNFEKARPCEHCGEYAPNLKDGLCECCYGDMYG